MAATILACPEFLAGYAGIPNLSFLGRSRMKSALYGYTYEYRFRGTPEAIDAAFRVITVDQSARTEEYGPFHDLVISTADDPSVATSQFATNTFSLPGNSLQKDIREHPLSLALGFDVIQKIDALLHDDDAPTTDSGIIAKIGTNADALDLYKMIRQRGGHFSFQISQYVFRATTIVSRRAQFAIAYGNVNRVYSFAQIKSEANPPTGFLISLDEIAAQYSAPPLPAGYAWGWLKQTPSVEMAAGNRYSIETEYWLEAWPTKYYPLKS